MPTRALSSFLHLTRMAADGLWRRKGRTALTMLGVFVGVCSLTLIVALGQGLSGMLNDTVAGEDNLRQIGVSAGLGDSQIRDADEVTIEGDMDDARRARLRRAAIARARPGPRIGRRPQPMTEKLLSELRAIPHVERVEPMVVERYAARVGDKKTEASLSLGVDAARARFKDRVLLGRYFSTPNADEVLIHEYVAYQWGYVTLDSQRELVGKDITLSLITNADNPMPGGFDVSALMSGVMGSLNEDEQKALPGIVSKLGAAMRGGSGALAATPEKIDHGFRIAGVFRDREASDPFNVAEDGNTFQVDLLMPQAAALRMFEAAPVNRELGYQRALVTADSSANAAGIEQALRDKRLTAFSVGSVLNNVSTALQVVTVVIAFLTGIALVVAALGILNTMLTSVLERTREIGLWKAVGATDAQVRGVFVLEAALIGIIGSAAGIGVALLLMIPGDALALEMIAQESAIPVAGSVFRTPVWLLVLGPTLAIAVAVLAALYPAWHASRIDPVKALRHE